jgi:hypothetical protein
VIVAARWLALVAAAAIASGCAADDRVAARDAQPAESEPEPVAVLATTPLIRELPSPHPLLRWAVIAGKDAEAALPVLDRLGEAQGWTAVFVGASDEMPDFGAMTLRDPQAVLDAAARIDAAAFLHGRATGFAGDDTRDTLLGRWIEDPDARAAVFGKPYYVWNDVDGRRVDKLFVALVPTRDAWQVPAFVQNGGWNDMPDPSEQVAVLHYWHDRYGARLRTFSDDIMEFEVARPPQGRDAALVLAYEQFGFTSDLVYQGAGALRPLASGLDGGHYWYFWWD